MLNLLSPEALILPAGIQLRMLREGDLHEYKRLRDAMLSAHDEAFTSDAASERGRSAESYRNRLSQANGVGCMFTVTAWRGEQLVGAVSCEREGRAKIRHIAHVVGMMVADEQQGRGLGRALLYCALRLLGTEPEIRMATLSVSSGNEGAIRLYESLGFRRYGQLPGALKLADGRLIGKDLMALDLPPPP